MSHARWVVKSNDFIEARYDWTVLMHRIVMMLVAQLDSRSNDSFERQRVYISDLKELCGRSGNSLHEDAATAAEALLDQQIKVRGDDGTYKRGYNLVTFTEYKEEGGEAFIEARFGEDMRPFLLDLRGRFTKYELRQAVRLSSPYSVRLFELIKMREGLGYVDLTIDELRQRLCLEDKYKRFTDLKRRVLEPACNEVEEKCPTYFDYKVLREGRSPVAVKFIIRKQNIEAGSRELLDEPNQSNDGLPAGKGRGHKSESSETVDPFWNWFSQLSQEDRRSWRERAMQKVEEKMPHAMPWEQEEERERIMRQWWEES